MGEKINYHLATFLNEFIELFAKEVSNSLGKEMQLQKRNSSSSNSLLTTDELASSLNVSKSHINKLRKKHQDFPVLNFDGAVRFRQSEVEAFFRNIT